MNRKIRTGRPDDERLDFTKVHHRMEKFQSKSGRRPRILLADMKENVSGNMVKMMAAAYADAGFDVDVNPGNGSFQMIARAAVDNDVHAIGITGLAAGISNLKKHLITEKADDVIIISDDGAFFEKQACCNRNLETFIARSVDTILCTLGV